jgi:hypothetical protein
MAFVRFLGIQWPQSLFELLTATIKNVQAFRQELIARDLAPKTINRRISSRSSFYKYLAAAEIRLPITAPNPAHVSTHRTHCVLPPPRCFWMQALTSPRRSTFWATDTSPQSRSMISAGAARQRARRTACVFRAGTTY